MNRKGATKMGSSMYAALAYSGHEELQITVLLVLSMIYYLHTYMYTYVCVCIYIYIYIHTCYNGIFRT